MMSTTLHAVMAAGLAIAPSAVAATSPSETSLITLDETSGSHASTTTSAHEDARTVVHLTTNASSLHKDTFNTDARAYITSLVHRHTLPAKVMQGDDLAPKTVVDIIDPSLHKVGFYHAQGMTFSASDEDITNAALPQAKQSHWPQAFAAMDAKAFAPKSSSNNDTDHVSSANKVGVGLGVIGLPLAGLALMWGRRFFVSRQEQQRREEAKRAEDQRRKDEQAEADAMARPDRDLLIAHQEKIVAAIDPHLSHDLRERLRIKSTPKIIRNYLDHGADGWSLSKMHDLESASANFLRTKPGVALALYRDDAKVTTSADDVIHRLEVLDEAPGDAHNLAARISEMCQTGMSQVRELRDEYRDTSRQSMFPDEYAEQFEQIYSTTRNDVAQAVREFADTPTGQAILQQRRSQVASSPSRSYLQQNSSLTSQTNADAMFNAVMYSEILSEMPSSHHNHSSSSSSSSSSFDSSSSSSSFDSSSFSSGGFDGGSSSW